ncbi:hypothetical protein AMTRI_Chr01g130750 [Amborella trichopoda]
MFLPRQGSGSQSDPEMSHIKSTWLSHNKPCPRLLKKQHEMDSLGKYCQVTVHMDKGFVGKQFNIKLRFFKQMGVIKFSDRQWHLESKIMPSHRTKLLSSLEEPETC